MTILPANIARVPNALASHIMLGSITRSNLDLLNMQGQLSSGKRFVRPSGDPIGTSVVSVIDDVLERRTQRLRNMSHAESVLASTDAALGDLNSILIEAKGIAASQIGVGSDEATRRNQARVIDAMLSEVTNISRRKFQEIQLFGGASSGASPFESLLGGIRYTGEGEGLITDLGQSIPFPITVSGDQAFGALSARVKGERDLDPVMLGSTRLLDLNGARGLGVDLGSIEVTVGVSKLTVDLSDAHTAQDIADTLRTEIQTIDGTADVRIDPVARNRFEIFGNALAITIADPGGPATAADLGLDTTYPPGGALGFDVDPRITEDLPLASLSGVTVPLGTIRLTNMGQSRDLDLSGATTVQDVRNLVQGLNIGVRVEIAESGDRLDFVNELSGGTMSIGEVGGGTTATELGVRSLTGGTPLSEFNDGLGVQIRTGSVDPVTGLPDPAKDLDVRITTKSGLTFDVDFAGATTVQDVIDAINAAAAPSVTASLVPDGNGIRLDDATAGGGVLTVDALNGSFAGHDLGILGSAPLPGGAIIDGTDRASVAVDGVFSHLIALRDALETNDERGITLAGSKLEADIARASETRAEVGVRSRRVADATDREEELRIQDSGLKSTVQDLDFTEAALRFSLLQQQLQAALATAGQVSSLSLLDFLR